MAYDDKGSGIGLHNLQTDTVNLINGVRAPASAADKQSTFTAPLTAAERAAFSAATPNRFAFKHAHSQRNPEKDWGRDTLDSLLFAFYVLNQQFGPLDAAGHHHLRTLTPSNTTVIAGGVSNGGGAVLTAAEQDTLGLIDGVVAGEPQVQVALTTSLDMRQGTQLVPTHSKTLLELATIAAVYQPCAARASAAAGSPGAALLPDAASANRCAALQSKGLVVGNTTTEQGDDALARMMTYGWPAEAAVLNASHYRLALTGVVLTYANAYGRFSVADNLCGFSIGATDAGGNPIPLPANSEAAIFSTANGLAPTGGINIIYNDSVGGPKLDLLGVSPSTGLADLSLDGALCLYGLATGMDLQTGAPLTGAALDRSKRVQAGIAEVLTTSNLRGKPAIIVQGRADTLEPVNHTGRAYYGKNLAVEGSNSHVRYYEVTNAQHFDTFIDNPAVPGYDSRFVPLLRYFNQSLDLMINSLQSHTALPPSQLVRTVPRGGTPGAAPALTPANVPPIADAPAAAEQITFSGHTLMIPE